MAYLVIDCADKILAKLDHLEALFVSWQDALNKLKADFDAAATRVNGDLATLNTQVGDLKTQVTTLTTQLANSDIPADAQATLDALDAAVNALDVPAPVPTPPTPPTPEPTPAPAGT